MTGVQTCALPILFNILNQEIFTENLVNVTGVYNKQINLADHPAGMYNLQLSRDNEIINKKLIIE